MSSCLLVVLLGFATAAFGDSTQRPTVRILSWNISEDAFVAYPQEFGAVLRWAKPDIVMLDEVSPKTDLDRLRESLAALQRERRWHIKRSMSGGRQRVVIASVYPLEAVPEFCGIVDYDQQQRSTILDAMSEQQRSNPRFDLDAGLSVAVARVVTAGGRLLIGSTDFECCGDGPDDWPEVRRRVEARLLRSRIRRVLDRGAADGVVLAGDFNLVESTFAMSIVAGPYPGPVSSLIAAELYHPDGVSTWTWDGRGTPFPSDVLDYQFYSPGQLKIVSGQVLDTESLSARQLDALQLDRDALKRTGEHRPLLVEYTWH